MKFNKVTIFLLLACLFISFIMISFLFRGVIPKIPKMVKWSPVESPEKAGEKLVGFLFPLLKESERVNILIVSEESRVFPLTETGKFKHDESLQGDLGFSELFFESFFFSKEPKKRGLRLNFKE